ncbi:hypothetical protein LTR05_004909 [Lithohypha guttulata]|uniref:F-box domain-containing protein n=1 Tax=Lithohypha guttulata TaxID=1690604 RepID=A0AAN7YGE3_9EURO|nr:hypothetical protein LTR05_004909 [Lithohypha guttulata]
MQLPDEIILIIFSHLLDMAHFSPTLDLSIFSAMRVNKKFRDIAISTILDETMSATRRKDFDKRVKKVLKFEDRLIEIKYGTSDEVGWSRMVTEYSMVKVYTPGKGFVLVRDEGIDDEVNDRRERIARMRAWDWEFVKL